MKKKPTESVNYEMIEEVLTDQLKPIVKMLEESQHSIAKQEKNNEELRAGIDKILENETIKVMLEEKKVELGELQRNNDELENKYKQKKKQVDTMNRKYHTVEGDFEGYTKSIKKIKSSGSWKVTSPIRKVGDVRKKSN